MKKLIASFIIIMGVKDLCAGSLVEQRREVAMFDTIELRGCGTLRIYEGEISSVSVQADESLMKHLKTEVVNGELRLSRDPLLLQPVPSDSVIWNVSVTKLKEIRVLGAAKAEVGPLSGEKLEIVISGSGKLIAKELSFGYCGIESNGSAYLELERLRADTVQCRMSGSGSVRLASLGARKLNTEISGGADIFIKGNVIESSVDVSGSARYNALDLQSERVTVNMNGSGKVAVYAQKELSIVSAGSGTVFYRGRPKIDQKIAGSTQIKQVD